MKKVEIEIKGMSCGGCARTVEKSLSEIDGAENILVSSAENKASLEVSDGVEESLLKHHIKKTGYDPVKVKFK